LLNRTSRKSSSEGQIVEQNEPEAFFNNPQNKRTQLFLSQILGH